MHMQHALIHIQIVILPHGHTGVTQISHCTFDDIFFKAIQDPLLSTVTIDGNLMNVSERQ